MSKYVLYALVLSLLANPMDTPKSRLNPHDQRQAIRDQRAMDYLKAQERRNQRSLVIEMKATEETTTETTSEETTTETTLDPDFVPEAILRQRAKMEHQEDDETPPSPPQETQAASETPREEPQMPQDPLGRLRAIWSQSQGENLSWVDLGPYFTKQTEFLDGMNKQAVLNTLQEALEIYKAKFGEIDLERALQNLPSYLERLDQLRIQAQDLWTPQKLSRVLVSLNLMDQSKENVQLKTSKDWPTTSPWAKIQDTLKDLKDPSKRPQETIQEENLVPTTEAPEMPLETIPEPSWEEIEDYPGEVFEVGQDMVEE